MTRMCAPKIVLLFQTHAQTPTPHFCARQPSTCAFACVLLQLEADRASEASHAKLLQDDVVKLQERVAALVAGGGRDTDAQSDQDRRGRGGVRGAGCGGGRRAARQYRSHGVLSGHWLQFNLASWTVWHPLSRCLDARQLPVAKVLQQMAPFGAAPDARFHSLRCALERFHFCQVMPER
eukprot:300241-Chlamydomonas_euryale.AAC.3